MNEREGLKSADDRGSSTNGDDDERKPPKRKNVRLLLRATRRRNIALRKQNQGLVQVLKKIRQDAILTDSHLQNIEVSDG